MTYAFVFPGQGSQNVGMGKALAETFSEAREVFDEVDDTLGQKLSTLMFEGPSDQLTLTENAQPAIMAASMAVIRVLEKQGKVQLDRSAQFVAGHSLGEYAALCAAGSLSLGDTARLLRIRGRAMQKAVAAGDGGMVALIAPDLDRALVQAVLAEASQGDVCVLANDNSPDQVVISGAAAALDRAVEAAKAKGIKRCIKLDVSAPFHSPLMQPAAEAMRVALEETILRSPSVPVVANVTAQPVVDPDVIRALLVEQVTSSVRWRESVLYMKEKGVRNFVECGEGKVLCGLARRIDRDLLSNALSSPDDIEAFLKGFSA
ncbi:MAG: ACP S-malonyltransferase [Alphaproteobacteria bacterium]|nr:ACP S-malonyltransferase [Alphaproteobacteria bacterium]